MQSVVSCLTPSLVTHSIGGAIAFRLPGGARAETPPGRGLRACQLDVRLNDLLLLRGIHYQVPMVTFFRSCKRSPATLVHADPTRIGKLEITFLDRKSTR